MSDDTATAATTTAATSQTTSPSGDGQSATTSQASQAGQTTQQQTTSQQQAPARPEYIPEKFWDAAAGKISDESALSAHFNEIIARDAAEQSRRLALPESPDKYEVKLPDGFKPPEGVEFKFSDPLLAQARATAHKLGIGQEGFSELLGLYAGAQVANQQQIVAARNAEIAKLGTAGPARVDALTTFWKAQLGEAEGAQVMSRVLTASDVALHEKIVARMQGQNGSSFSTRGREAPTQPGRLSPEQVAKLSPADRLDYSRRFNQSAMPDWKDPRAA